jgi:hypothetical protein
MNLSSHSTDSTHQQKLKKILKSGRQPTAAANISIPPVLFYSCSPEEIEKEKKVDAGRLASKPAHFQGTPSDTRTQLE